MAIYNSDVNLGVTTGAAFAGEVDVYIEGNSAQGVGNSLTDVTAVTTGNVAQLTQNNATMTGRNMTYLCTNFFNSTIGSSSPVTFENSSIHTVTSASDWFFPMTLDNVDIYNTSATGGNAGIFGYDHQHRRQDRFPSHLHRSQRYRQWQMCYRYLHCPMSLGRTSR